MNKNIRYLPVDIPILENLDFSGIDCEDLSKKLHVKDWFDPIYVLTEENQIKENFAKKNRHFIEWLKYLPLKKWSYASVQFQKKSIKEHLDMRIPNDNLEFYRNLHRNEPCGYRIVLNGTKEDIMYLVDDYGKKIYTKLPDTTNTYLINYTQGIHGTEDDVGRSVLLPAFFIDDKKHKQLVEKSIKKYGDYII